MGIAQLFTQTVSVEPFTGQDSYGRTYGPAQTVTCWVEDGNKLVRDSSGNETVAAATVYASLGDADKFPVGSRVTMPTGRVSTVIVSDTFTVGNPDADHIEVSLV